MFGGSADLLAIVNFFDLCDDAAQEMNFNSEKQPWSNTINVGQ